MSGLKNEKPKTGGGGSFGEVPPEGKHRAAIVAIVDLGHHDESFEGKGTKSRHKLLIAWELLGKARMKNGNPFIMAETYTWATGDLAHYRKIWAAHLGTIKREEDIVGQDPEKLLGTACLMKIVHKDNGKDGDEKRTYANIALITELPDDDDVGKQVKTSNVPFMWDMSSKGEYRDHDWIPFVFDRGQGKRVPVSEMIANSKERSGKATLPAGAASAQDDGEAF